MAKKINIAVLGSTNGTDLQAILDAIEKNELEEAELKIVISNKEDAYILARAKQAGFPTLFIDSKNKSREEFDQEVMKILEKNKIDLVLLIGYMKYLSKEFVKRYQNRIMNIHPSLLPAFAGGMDKNVHQEILDHGVKVTGCTLHFVDEGADTGPIIMQRAVEIVENETVNSLKEKVQKLEQEIILKAIKLFAQGKIKVEGNRVVEI
jgi:phosphoribosylglycinamide formyltransferase 1